MRKVYFTKSKLTNFLSIGTEPVEITFKRGINIITGENLDLVNRKNGIGKSTIADGFHFALFGETIRDIKSSSIINKFTNKTCEAVVEFYTDENSVKTNYKVVRTLKPSKLFLFENDVDITKSTMEQTDVHIQKILNASKEVFQNSVIMSVNGTTPFMAKKKVEKRKFVEGILDISIFSEMLKDVREEYNITLKEFDSDKIRLEEHGNQKKVLEEQLELFKMNQQTKISELNKKLQINSEKTETLKKEVYTLKSSITLSKKELSELCENVSEKILTVKKESKEYVDQNTKLNNALTKIEYNIELQKRLKKECDDLKSAIKIEKESLGTKLDVSDLDKKLLYLKEERLKLDEDKKKSQKDIEITKTLINDIKYDVSSAEKDIEKIKKNKGNCEWCKKSIDDILKPVNEKKIDDFSNTIKRLQSELRLKNEIVENLSSSIKKISERINQIDEDSGEIKQKKISVERDNKDIDTKSKQISEKETTLNSKKEELEGLKDFSERKPSIEEEIKKNEEILEGMATNVEKLQKKKERIQEQISEVSIVENDIKSKNSQITSCLETDEDLKDEIKKETEKALNNSLSEKIETYSKSIIGLKSSVEKNEIMLEIMNNAKFILSEEGVKSYIVKKILSILNSKISYYLTKLDAPCNIVFDEYFEDVILDRKKQETEYWNFSGAERKAIDFAIMFAFIDLLRLNGNVCFNTLFFDELLDSSMDAKGIDNVINILHDRVETYAENIYVISHRPESTKHMTGELILLQKKNDITTLRK